MIVHKHQKFPLPDFIPDGEHDGAGSYHKGELLLFEDCLIDMSDYALDQMDEAVGVTWGASAEFVRCVIRGAGKLFLIGSGDDDHVKDDNETVVVLRECILEDFGRRGPEVQSGARCFLRDCLVRNWGTPDRFTVRSFGAWAHRGGYIRATNTLFVNNVKPPLRQSVTDRVNHFFQAIKDEGLSAILDPLTYASGVCRGLTCADTGLVEAYHCYDQLGQIIVQGNFNPMPFEEAKQRMEHLMDIYHRVCMELKPSILA